MMYRYFCRKQLQINHAKNPSIYTHLLRNPYPKSISNISNPTNFPSPSLSYLINSWGLTQESALLVLKKTPFKITEKSDAVLTFFRAQGFDQTQITKIITNRPSLISSNVDKTLKPKFEFLLRLGISVPDLTRAIAAEPAILNSSLEKQIIPAYHRFKSLVGSDENVASALKSTVSILLFYIQTKMFSNLSILRKHKVPESRIMKMIIANPNTFKGDSSRFSEIVMEVERMGFDPSSSVFTKAVEAFAAMSAKGWEKKMEVYRSFGWSDSEIISAFKKQPMCMITSEKKIRKGMDYFMNEMGMSPSMISQCPNIILLSLEKRIVPRHFVMEVLTSRNVVGKNYRISCVLIVSEKYFLERYVIRYQKQIPELLEDYRARMQLTR